MDFFDNWEGQFGDRILNAHEGSNAKVTRVFIFSKRDQIKLKDIDEMKLQHEKGIEVRVYIDDEDPIYRLPTNKSMDFTIIDDSKVIGITESFGDNNNSARWYLNNESIANERRDMKDSLMNGSKPFTEDVEVWWSQRRSSSKKT